MGFKVGRDTYTFLKKKISGFFFKRGISVFRIWRTTLVWKNHSRVGLIGSGGQTLNLYVRLGSGLVADFL